MNVELIYPMAAMVLLTFTVLIAMYRSRVRAVRAGDADARYYKTYQEGSEPRETAQLSRHIVNCFETPTLFYTACIAGMITGYYAGVMLALAWLYVGLRIVHAMVHTGSNKLPARIRSFFSSLLVLMIMWGTLVAGVATS